MSHFKQLSIVIPVGPDDNTWPSLLAELKSAGIESEIILSACQPQVASLELPADVIWINGQQGRAQQLNTSAEKASGAVIWFLHADSHLTAGVSQTLQDYLQSAKQTLGYFKLKFAANGPQLMRLNAWAANIRSRYFGLPFGDQGFMLPKAIFQALKGFDVTLPMGEDLDFVVRAQAAKIALQAFDTELITSARRYQKQGWLQTTARYVYLTLCLNYQAKRRLRGAS